MINFSAFLGAATMYTRYKIVEKQNQTSYFSTPVFNLVSLVLGLMGCIGMGIVANFQELAVPVVHDGGALLAFVCGVVYTLLQSIISYKSCPQWNSVLMCHVRLAISAVSCAAVIPMIACASLISITKLEWDPREKDYVYHIVSAVCEWTVAFGFIFYFLTFIQDFQVNSNTSDRSARKTDITFLSKPFAQGQPRAAHSRMTANISTDKSHPRPKTKPDRPSGLDVFQGSCLTFRKSTTQRGRLTADDPSPA
ncbi:DNA damage-regulated autophagy modulator protein 1 [Carlito syrichta]|uniref:DNA damage-regulated autophagy modulator protein 1 n=1 Tax=Carlito syrichta TaxID=1868482 RepID=A0A3Q0DSL1_CARSF|nr:DNA damage-regulated autophagy modulator protein 1 [Carlito syrichta]